MGPLAGIRIVELTGIGPGPMSAMLLADLGAKVLRIFSVLRLASAINRYGSRKEPDMRVVQRRRPCGLFSIRTGWWREASAIAVSVLG